MQQKQLTKKQRYHLWASVKRGVTQKEIAETIGVYPSTICREIQRNKDSSTGEYHYAFAQTKAPRMQQNKAKYSVFTSKI